MRSPKRVDNAYGKEIINGKEYYDCHQCDEVFRDVKDIVRHVFRDHLWPQEVTTAAPVVVRTSLPQDTHRDNRRSNDGHRKSGHKSPRIPLPPTLLIKGVHRMSDQLKDHRKSVATKSDQIKHYAKKQSKSLSETKHSINGRPPAHTSGHSVPKRPLNGQKSITADPLRHEAERLLKRLLDKKRAISGQSPAHSSGQSRPKRPRYDSPFAPTSKHAINRVPTTAKPNGGTSSQPLSSALPKNTQSDDQLMDNDFNVDTKRFSCLEKGCGKTFCFMPSLIQHRLKHTEKRVDKTAANLTTKATTNTLKAKANTTGHKRTYSAIPGYQRMGPKWYKVRRLTDRSLYRDKKESHQHDPNYMGFQSLKPLKGWYELNVDKGQRHYLCRYKLSDDSYCTYRATRSQRMARHLNCSHFRNRRFACRQSGCSRVYLNPTTLRQHELNHKCGFGIENGRYMNSVCGNKNIMRFRRSVIGPDGRSKVYQCAICDRESTSHTAIKRHIHNQHLCPIRNEYIECSPPIPTADSVPEISAGADSDGDDIQIIEENLATDTGRRESRVSPETKQFLLERNARPVSTARHRFCMQQLERLVRIRPFFVRTLIDGHTRYVCQYLDCRFPAKTLEYISMHLKGKHFVN